MLSKKLNGITVRKAITLENLKDLILLGGKKGLDRRILSVNVMEVPDILPWVKEGQLLLTTAFSIKDDPVAQEKLIPELSKNGLAGLVIKPKRYLDKIPQTMIEAANLHDFPLFEMPQHLSHPIIMETLYGELVSRQTTILRRSIDAHTKLMKVALESGGIPAICETLYQISQNPVFIAGADGKVLWKYPVNIAVRLEDALMSRLRKGQGFYSNLMAQGHFHLDENKIGIVQYPIHVAGKWHGTIIIVELNRQLQEIDYIAIEQASTVAALTIINEIALREVEQKYRNDFLFDWFNGRIMSEIELIQRGSLVGYELRYSFILIVINIDSYQELWQGDAKSKANIQNLQSQLHGAIEAVANAYCNYFIVGERGGRFVLLLKAEHDLGYSENMELGKKVASQVLGAFKKQTKHSCTAGIGRFRPSITDIHLSYEEALKAVSVQKYLNRPSRVLSFDDLGVFRLLSGGNMEEAAHIVRELYSPLIQHDRDTNSQLVQTLRVYFQCNGNVSQASKQLFTHYNTVLYRLSKIQEITGMNFEDSEDRFNMQLAIKLGDALAEGKSP